MFLAFKDIGLGGALHEVPFARVVDDGVGYATMDRWYNGYGELRQFQGHAPEQGGMYREVGGRFRAGGGGRVEGGGDSPRARSSLLVLSG